MSQEELNKLIEKYLKGESSPEEMEVLKSFEIFTELKAKDQVFESLEAKHSIKESIFKDIQTGLKHSCQNNRDNSKVLKLNRYKKSWLKYSAAVVVLGLSTLFYLLKSDAFRFNSKPEPITVSDINSIKPGTDKATLTLGNGTVVALEKGNSFQGKYASSNGDEIVYNATKHPSNIELNTITIPRGGKFFIKLSDGTGVWLNSESQLKYPSGFVLGQSREVELVYGEAYFDVSPSTENSGSKFIVHNQNQDIEVLGTEFNLKAYQNENDVSTTLVEGKVLVGFNGDQRILLPNQQSQIDLNTKSIVIHNDVNVEDIISWRHGIFTFKGKSLKEIMNVISRWYDVDVVFENQELEVLRFRGVLSKNQNLEEILKTIKSLSVIKNYEIYGKNIIIN